MKTCRFGRLPRLALTVALTIGLVAPATASAGGNVQASPIGDPVWKLTDVNLFSAPIGTAASGYMEFGETMAAILPPPYYQFSPAQGITPGVPNPGPYIYDIRRGVAALGLQGDGRFTSGDFSDGNGVWVAYMVIPRRPGHAPQGSSPDFALGPIIPNRLFPIHVNGITERSGQPFDPFLASFTVPPLDALSPPFNVDGYSHFPVFIADNADFGPPPVAGDYRYEITMLDQNGDGWQVTVSFNVTST